MAIISLGFALLAYFWPKESADNADGLVVYEGLNPIQIVWLAMVWFFQVTFGAAWGFFMSGVKHALGFVGAALEGAMLFIGILTTSAFGLKSNTSVLYRMTVASVARWLCDHIPVLEDACLHLVDS